MMRNFLIIKSNIQANRNSAINISYNNYFEMTKPLLNVLDTTCNGENEK